MVTKDFRYLFSFLDNFTIKPGYLKRVIDYLINSKNETEAYARTNEVIYLKLCAAIYGNNSKETTEVRRIRDECDVFKKSQSSDEHFINSSFHLYDQQNKQWLPLET